MIIIELIERIDDVMNYLIGDELKYQVDDEVNLRIIEGIITALSYE